MCTLAARPDALERNPVRALGPVSAKAKKAPRAIGWVMADHLRTELVLDTVGMAVPTRKPAAGTVHHIDRCSQGGLNRPSQHLEREVVDGAVRAEAEEGPRLPGSDPVAGPADGWRGARTGCASGPRSARRVDRRCRSRGRRVVA
jgi:hypothetical protein